MKIKFILGVIIIALISGCKCSNEGNDNDSLEVPDSIANKGVYKVSDEAMDKITENISSPIETAALIKSLNVPFSKEHLATTDYVDDYSTSFKQSIILGIYGADLGYLNMYNKTSVSIDYLKSIKKIANKLKIGQFFDFSTLKRLASSSENIDSLIYISQRNFKQMDEYLRENNRSNLSALTIAGAWLEGLYLTSEVYQSNPDPQLREAIGEQKIMLSNLMILLENYKNSPNFKELIQDFKKIHDIFKEVNITVEQGETEQIIDENGQLSFKQNDKSIVKITDEQLYKIIEETNKVRNNLISL